MMGRNVTDKQLAIKEKTRRWARRIKVQPSQIRVQKMTRKWASCSTTGWVCLSTDLAEEPGPFQDFVIVHELLHLRVPNHGKLFKSLLSAYLPEARDNRHAIERDENRVHNSQPLLETEVS